MTDGVSSSVTPASFQVLTNNDLLNCIFKFMPAEAKWQRRDLPRCAVVSRAFYDPSIRVLWRALRTPLPLWHLLAPPDVSFPKDEFNIAAYTHLVYLQKVSAAELYNDAMRWDRFLWHSSHVRKLCLILSPKENEAHLPLLRAVLAKNGGKTVFPLVSSLDWVEDKTTTMLQDPSLSPLFTPSLRVASIKLGATKHLQSAGSLRRLRESSPFLESITLTTDLDMDIPLVRELASFNCLREIRLPSLPPPEAFQILAVRPNLASLTLKDVASPWTALNERILVPHLLRLEVCGTSQCLTSFLGATHFDVLKTVGFGFNPSVRPSDITITDIIPVLEAFCGAISSSSLQNLSLSWLDGSQDHPPLREVLAPILSLPAIRSFCFSSLLDVAKQEDEDEDVKAFARAWPHLEGLSVHNGLIATPALSVAAIHELYTNCPNLREVSLTGLQYPAIGVHAILAPRPDDVPPHPLKSLFFGKVVVPPSAAEGAMEGLLRYFFDLFPRLDHPVVQTPYGPLRIPPGGACA